MATSDLAERDRMQARAFEIADEAMFCALDSYGVIGDDAATVYGLADENGHEVTQLSAACPELREAIEWLRDRDYVTVDTDDAGEHVNVHKRPGE